MKKLILLAVTMIIFYFILSYLQGMAGADPLSDICKESSGCTLAHIQSHNDGERIRLEVALAIRVCADQWETYDSFWKIFGSKVGKMISPMPYPDCPRPDEPKCHWEMKTIILSPGVLDKPSGHIFKFKDGWEPWIPQTDNYFLLKRQVCDQRKD